MKEITDVLACQLMDDLACAYISFADCVICDEHGEPAITEENLKAAEEWARETFHEVFTSLSEKFGITTDDIHIVETGSLEPGRFNNFCK